MDFARRFAWASRQRATGLAPRRHKRAVMLSETKHPLAISLGPVADQSEILRFAQNDIRAGRLQSQFLLDLFHACKEFSE